MFTKSGEISPMGSAATPAQEMHHIVVAMVQARRDEGAERATARTARELGLSQSRVVEILKGRVGRVWADEYLAARQRYARWCDQQAATSQTKAAQFAARAAALRETLCASSD